MLHQSARVGTSRWASCSSWVGRSRADARSVLTSARQRWAASACLRAVMSRKTSTAPLDLPLRVADRRAAVVNRRLPAVFREQQRMVREADDDALADDARHRVLDWLARLSR